MAYHAGEHDGVIAFGGGSALDAAKAIALMVGQDRPLWDFEDKADWYAGQCFGMVLWLLSLLRQELAQR